MYEQDRLATVSARTRAEMGMKEEINTASFIASEPLVLPVQEHTRKTRVEEHGEAMSASVNFETSS